MMELNHRITLHTRIFFVSVVVIVRTLSAYLSCTVGIPSGRNSEEFSLGIQTRLIPWAFYVLIFIAIYRNHSRPSIRSEGLTQVIPSSSGVRRDVFAVTRLTAILMAASCFVSLLSSCFVRRRFPLMYTAAISHCISSSSFSYRFQGSLYQLIVFEAITHSR